MRNVRDFFKLILKSVYLFVQLCSGKTRLRKSLEELIDCSKSFFKYLSSASRLKKASMK